MTLKEKWLCGILCGGMATFVGGDGLLFAESNPLSAGVEAFEQHRWTIALSEFLNVLRQEPGNVQAHAYVTLTARELETARRAAIHAQRLEFLNDALRRLDDNRMDSAPLQRALDDTTQAEQHSREDRWHAQCEEARMERDLGHLLAANDLVLKILAEEPGYAEAQRELSELQSHLRQALDKTGGLSIQERYAYEGFYAYGQADYAGAWIAWQKVHVVVEQGVSPAEAASRIAALHFADYEKIAQSHVEEEKRTAAERSLFQEGISLYQAGRYNQALGTFRRLGAPPK